jgi:hypothetical protein
MNGQRLSAPNIWTKKKPPDLYLNGNSQKHREPTVRRLRNCRFLVEVVRKLSNLLFAFPNNSIALLKGVSMIMDKFADIVDEGVVFSAPDLVFGYSAWPSVTRANNGDLLAVYSGKRIEHVCPFGKVILQRSRDEGKTWSAPIIAIDTPLDDRDAGVTVLSGGRVVVTTFNNTRKEQAEWADKRSFTPDERGSLIKAYLPLVNDKMEDKYLGSLISVSEDDGFSFGEPFKSPVSAPHGSNLMKDGSLIYAGTPFPSKPAGADGQIAVYKSGDCRNFELLAEINRGPEAMDGLYCEPHVIELPGGRIVVHIRVQGDYEGEQLFTVMQSVSDDGGKTFSVPRLTGAAGSPPHLLLHSSGTLVCVYGKRKPPYGIQAMFSRDNAETWDTGYYLWNQGADGDLGYPASVELSNGDIFTIYYAKRLGQNLTSILWTRWRIPG